MEETYTTKAIVLNRQPFRENDSRVVVYSFELGKMDLVARGTKKTLSKLAGLVEPISLIKTMVIKGRQYDYIGNVVSLESYYNIKNDFNKLLSAGQAIRIFNQLIKENLADEKVFLLLIDFLNIINYSQPPEVNYNLISSYYNLKLLVCLGYQPELYYCLKCKKKIEPDSNRFDYANGGIICYKCGKINNSLTISENCIKVLRLVLDNNLDYCLKLKINNQTEKEVNTTIKYFLDYNIKY
ncbi:MAG: DNA repair protein RecO [Patescibacteria group bacterium]